MDPRYDGGKLNRRTTEDLVELVALRGREYLFYPAMPIDFEIAPGVDLERDVRARIAPGVAVADELKTMDARIFRAQQMPRRS